MRFVWRSVAYVCLLQPCPCFLRCLWIENRVYPVWNGNGEWRSYASLHQSDSDECVVHLGTWPWWRFLLNSFMYEFPWFPWFGYFFGIGLCGGSPRMRCNGQSESRGKGHGRKAHRKNGKGGGSSPLNLPIQTESALIPTATRSLQVK